MHIFRVWAPIAHQVEVDVEGARHAMKRQHRGWWTTTVEECGPGRDYGFVIDGQGPFPDPRSRWQPNGVHARSRLFNDAEFTWTDAGFRAPPLGSSVVYEIHVGTFTPEGTFEAIESRLDHLLALGVTHIELMPVNAFAGQRGWGYDGVGLYAVQESYGGPAGLKRLVNACHARGIAVILDVVYNHFGPSGNYLHLFGPYFSRRYQTPWGGAVNFDGPDSDEVRRFFVDNALMWLRDYHLDGLRLDAVHAILDTSATPFLEQLACEVRSLEAHLSRPITLIAESDLNDPRLLWPRVRGGFGLDAQWNDDFHHALHACLTGERSGYYEDFGTLADLGKSLTQAFVYDGRYSHHRGRCHGRPHEGVSGHAFLVYTQNHDQTGNRALGDRLSQMVDERRLRIAAALTLTSSFVPMLFMGEEWAASTPFQYFTDHEEPDLREAIRHGRQREFAAFGWDPQSIPDPQALHTFTRSKLNWEEIHHDAHARTLDWYRRLIQLRRQLPVLTDGRMDQVRVDFDEQARWIKVERGPLVVACNLGEYPRPLRLSPGTHGILLASVEGARIDRGNDDSASSSNGPGESLWLPAVSVVILERA